MSATAVPPVTVVGFGVPPDRSLQQRTEALKRGNAIRLRRAQLKRDLKSGTASVLDLIEDPPEYILSMKLLDLLLAAPRVGRVKALTLLKRCEISPVKTVGGITSRQRDEVVAARIWRKR